MQTYVGKTHPGRRPAWRLESRSGDVSAQAAAAHPVTCPTISRKGTVVLRASHWEHLNGTVLRSPPYLSSPSSPLASLMPGWACAVRAVGRRQRKERCTDNRQLGPWQRKRQQMGWRGIGVQLGCMGQSQYGASTRRGRSEEGAMSNTDVCFPNRMSHWRPVALSLDFEHTPVSYITYSVPSISMTACSVSPTSPIGVVAGLVNRPLLPGLAQDKLVRAGIDVNVPLFLCLSAFNAHPFQIILIRPPAMSSWALGAAGTWLCS